MKPVQRTGYIPSYIVTRKGDMIEIERRIVYNSVNQT